MNKTYYLSYTAQQLIKENAACRAEGKTANNVILLSIALTAQRAACSLLSLYLCYISSKQCFEDMRFFKFSLHCQYAASPSTKKGVVIYKQVVAFELAQSFFFRKKSPCGGWHPFFEKRDQSCTMFIVLWSAAFLFSFFIMATFPLTNAGFFKDWMLNLKLQPC